MRASIVPRSHSRATVSEVRRHASIMRMTAVRPGTRKLELFSSGLYQTQVRSSIGTGLGALGIQ